MSENEKELRQQCVIWMAIAKAMFSARIGEAPEKDRENTAAVILQGLQTAVQFDDGRHLAPVMERCIAELKEHAQEHGVLPK